MTKMTKTTYKKMLGLLNARLETVRGILQLAADTEGANFSDLDQWNEYHDLMTEIKNEISDLESAWNQRNWTASDYASWNLVSNNID